MFPACIHDPHQKPFWRWERARWLIENRGTRRKAAKLFNDEYSVEAIRFIRKYNRCADQLDYFDLSLEKPGLFWAHKIFQAMDQKSVRWEIEARLLTGQTCEEIAYSVKSTASVIEHYEALFFNVQPYLEHKGYIVQTVIGEALHNGTLRERDYDVLWKILSFKFGATMADFLTRTGTESSHLTSDDQIKPCLQDDFRHTSTRRAAVAARTLVVNQFNAHIFIENFHKMAELEGKDGGAGNEATLLKNIEAFVIGFPYTTNREYPKGVDANRMKYYDESGTELRARHLIQVGLGQETEEIKQLALVKFPEPDKDVQPAHQ
jgi:hypothetical protein